MDSENYHIPDEVAGLVPTQWTMKVGRTGALRTVELSIALSSVLGIEGRIGDAFRLNIVRNRMESGIVHWSPTEGYANARPTNAGYCILTGPAASQFKLPQLSTNNPSGLIMAGRPGTITALTGYPLSLTVFNPLTGVLKDTSPYTVSVHDKTGRAVLKQQMTLKSWPQTFTLRPDALPAGQYSFRVQSASSKALSLAVPIAWQSAIFVEAEDRAQYKSEGKEAPFTAGYPRGVGTEVLYLRPESRVTVSNYGTAVYMIMAPGFLGPGPHYGSSADAVLRCKVDNQPWRRIAMLGNAREIPLAENLPPGLHKVTVEWGQGARAPIDKFVFA